MLTRETLTAILDRVAPVAHRVVASATDIPWLNQSSSIGKTGSTPSRAIGDGADVPETWPSAEPPPLTVTRVFDILVAMGPDRPANRITMIDRDCDLAEATRVAHLQFGTERVLEVTEHRRAENRAPASTLPSDATTADRNRRKQCLSNQDNREIPGAAPAAFKLKPGSEKPSQKTSRTSSRVW
jgi:hypothetical protein